MNPVQAIQSAIGNYANFDGRARRSEYWWFFLFVNVAVAALSIAGAQVHPILSLVGGLVVLAFILPALAVTARRLHDTDRSGWWILVGIVPFGGLVILIMCVLPGTSGPNRFGTEPL